MNRLCLLFCGTPQFAVPTLKHLLAQPEFEVLAVFTQPDRPRGRSHQISSSPVKEVALAANLPVHQPEKIRAPEIQELLQSYSPDFIVIIAYGQIIPVRLLPIPRHGWINLHASLLPRYRGAAPINWAIVNGETLLQRELEIGAKETAPELSARLSEAGAPPMAETLRGLAAGKITPRPQNHSQATLAPMLKRDDGRIDWNHTATEIYNRMRGFAPWPGSHSVFRGNSCHLWAEPVSNKKRDAPPGTLLLEGDELLVVSGGATLLRLLAVQLEGRKRVSALEFENGARLKSGERFGHP